MKTCKNQIGPLKSLRHNNLEFATVLQHDPETGFSYLPEIEVSINHMKKELLLSYKRRT